jgi:uncharacterized Zn-binding protein involved in type VI secretion
MPPAARVGDPTGHPGVIGPPGVPTVLIGGQPAATASTLHTCSFPSPPPHPPSTIIPPCSTTVLIGGLPAARIGDMAACGAPIVMGCMTVMIGG